MYSLVLSHSFPNIKTPAQIHMRLSLAPTIAMPRLSWQWIHRSWIACVWGGSESRLGLRTRNRLLLRSRRWMESSEQVSTGQAPSQGAPTAQLLLKPQPLLREHKSTTSCKVVFIFLTTNQRSHIYRLNMPQHQ